MTGLPKLYMIVTLDPKMERGLTTPLFDNVNDCIVESEKLDNYYKINDRFLYSMYVYLLNYIWFIL